MRATNPPSNPELLDALAKFTVENKYDVRKLIVLITSSRVYQTSATPNATNEKDERNFSRAYFKRPDAEVLLDMICQAHGRAGEVHRVARRHAGGATVGQQGPQRLPEALRPAEPRDAPASASAPASRA